MARVCSQDPRDRVIDAALTGVPARQAAARFGVGVATAMVWVCWARETGERTARPQGQPRRSNPDPHRGFLLDLIEAKDNISLAEMQGRLVTERGFKASVGTIWTFLDRAGLTFERSPRMHWSRTVLKGREAWFGCWLDLDPGRLVLIDETGASTKMARLRGRARRGERLKSGIPHGHRRTTTSVAGPRLTGMVAPFVLDGPMNRSTLLAYLIHVLAPSPLTRDRLSFSRDRVLAIAAPRVFT